MLGLRGPDTVQYLLHGIRRLCSCHKIKLASQRLCPSLILTHPSRRCLQQLVRVGKLDVGRTDGHHEVTEVKVSRNRQEGGTAFSLACELALPERHVRGSLHFWTYLITDIFSYRYTGYSDTLLTVTDLINRMLPKNVTVSKYLLTVTLFTCPKGVIVTEDVCSLKFKREFMKALTPSIGHQGLFPVDAGSRLICCNATHLPLRPKLSSRIS